MLKIERQNITLTRGDTAYLKFIPKVRGEGSSYEDYELQDGDVVIFRVQKNPIFEKQAVIDLEENTAILTLIPEDTIDWKIQQYNYEVELVTALDEHFTFIANQKFIISEEIEQHD